MKAHKVTNPLAVGQIAPLIMKFYNRVKESSGLYDGITYESLYTYLARLIQFGKAYPEDKAEVWVAMDGTTPVGFAAWHVMDLPYIGTVFCPCLYNDTRNQKAIKELYDEFVNFGKRHRALIYRYHAVNDKVGEYFKSVLEKLDIDVKDTGAREYVGRKK
jgi:hypothetical protein